MEKITITEALSEINLIGKKIKSKQEKITGALVRYEHMPDLYAAAGGSEKMITEETQSMRDLMTKLARIRSAVSQANITNKITINQRERSIHDWLTWKREISESEIEFAKKVHMTIKHNVDQIQKQPQLIKQENTTEPQLAKLKVNTDFAYWIKESEELCDVLEKLDGQLSLKNATIFVEV